MPRSLKELINPSSPQQQEEQGKILWLSPSVLPGPTQKTPEQEGRGPQLSPFSRPGANVKKPGGPAASLSKECALRQTPARQILRLMFNLKVSLGLYSTRHAGGSPFCPTSFSSRPLPGILLDVSLPPPLPLLPTRLFSPHFWFYRCQTSPNPHSAILKICLFSENCQFSH